MHKRFPFYALDISFFYQRVSKHEGQYIDLHSLRKMFNASNNCSLWQAFWDEADQYPERPTIFLKLLISYLPNKGGGSTPKISKISLICLGILWC